jgi:hypothetical protein
MYLKLDPNGKVLHFLVNTIYKDQYFFVDEKQENIDLIYFSNFYFLYSVINNQLLITHKQLGTREYVLENIESNAIFAKPPFMPLNQKILKIKNNLFDNEGNHLAHYIKFENDKFVFDERINEYLELNEYVL